MKFPIRLALLMRKHDISRTRLANAIGLPYTTLRNYEKGDREPGHGTLIKIADYFGVSVDYLLGKDVVVVGSAEQSSDWSAPLDNAYESAPRPRQDAVCTVLDIPYVRPPAVPVPLSQSPLKPLSRPDPDDAEDNIIYVNFAQSEQRASAGTGVYLDDESMTSVRVRADALPGDCSRFPDRCFGIPVGGDSMEPAYRDGDLLIVSKEPVNVGETGVFILEGEGYVKQLGVGVLHSLNPAYADIRLTEDARCVGKVVGVLDPESVGENL